MLIYRIPKILKVLICEYIQMYTQNGSLHQYDTKLSLSIKHDLVLLIQLPFFDGEM